MNTTAAKAILRDCTNAIQYVSPNMSPVYLHDAPDHDCATVAELMIYQISMIDPLDTVSIIRWSPEQDKPEIVMSGISACSAVSMFHNGFFPDGLFVPVLADDETLFK